MFSADSFSNSSFDPDSFDFGAVSPTSGDRGQGEIRRRHKLLMFIIFFLIVF